MNHSLEYMVYIVHALYSDYEEYRICSYKHGSGCIKERKAHAVDYQYVVQAYGMHNTVV